jgi:hypothetical protein
MPAETSPYSNLANVIAGWTEMIQHINTGGTGYVHHFGTSVDQIGIGPIFPPPLLPFITLLGVRGVGEHGTYLGAAERAWDFDFVGYCNAATDTQEARLTAAADLLNDVLTALASDRVFGGYARDVVCFDHEIFASMADGVTPSYGVVTGSIRVTLQNGART